MHLIASFSKSYKVFHRKQSNLCHVSSRNIPPAKTMIMTSNNGEDVDDSDNVDNNGEVLRTVNVKSKN